MNLTETIETLDSVMQSDLIELGKLDKEKTQNEKIIIDKSFMNDDSGAKMNQKQPKTFDKYRS